MGEDKKSQKSPFRPLGRKLKALRNKANESLAEVSGAIELDVRQLASFELGQARPTEETLLLLISHFGARDDEAVQLWELAGYGTTKMPDARMSSASSVSPSMEFQPTAKGPILFTDVVDVMVNNYGVVMNFMQSGAADTKPHSVAKVGMSREHAKSVLQILQVTLSQTEQIIPKIPGTERRLITPDSSSSESTSK